MLAVGIFAVAVVAILALLPSLTRQSTESVEMLTAQRLPESVRVDLERVAGSGFDALAGAIPLMGTPLQNGYALVATRDGTRLHSVSAPPGAGAAIAQSDQYYLIEVWRFGQAPLAYDSTTAHLATYARVSWPYYNPGSAIPTPEADRSQLTFTVALNR